MPYGRNMNDCVLLPNEQIIIVNGAKVGTLFVKDPWGLYNIMNTESVFDCCTRAQCLQYHAFHCNE
jgi:hypothetical protein